MLYKSINDDNINDNYFYLENFENVESSENIENFKPVLVGYFPQ